MRYTLHDATGLQIGEAPTAQRIADIAKPGTYSVDHDALAYPAIVWRADVMGLCGTPMHTASDALAICESIDAAATYHANAQATVDAVNASTSLAASMARTAPAPSCDGWPSDPSCVGTVSMIGSKGFVYCSACGPERRASGYERVRKMTPAELRKVNAGEPLARY